VILADAWAPICFWPSRSEHNAKKKSTPGSFWRHICARYRSAAALVIRQKATECPFGSEQELKYSFTIHWVGNETAP